MNFTELMEEKRRMDKLLDKYLEHPLVTETTRSYNVLGDNEYFC